MLKSFGEDDSTEQHSAEDDSAKDDSAKAMGTE
jgi:hypothetical protein